MSIRSNEYFRIVYARPRKGSRRRLGILHDSRRRAGNTDEVDAIYRWMGRHLPVPPSEAFSADRALCWFTVEARDCIERIRHLAFLLERRGERLWQIYSRNPGLITYRDDYQVVAVPEDALRRFGREAGGSLE